MTLIIDGLKLMVLGMGMVYIFLALMIVFMNVQSRLLKPFAGMLEPPPPPPKRKPKPAAKADGGADQQRAVAAIAAVHAYRQDHQ